MKILITGGLGTIGSCLSASLYRGGHEVTIYDNSEIGNSKNLLLYLRQEEVSNIRIIAADILDIQNLNLAIEGSDICYHMAATLGTLNVVQQPIRMLQVNVTGTQNVVLECARRRIPVVIASTSMVYGKNPKAQVGEADELFVGGEIERGLWWYAVSKMTDECFARAVNLEIPDAKVLTIRPFNVISPVQNSDVGFVVPRFYAAALSGAPLVVYGDGMQKRTFTWAQDFVDCLINLVETGKAWNQTVNIGGTEEITVLDLAKKIKLKTESLSEIEFVDPQQLFRGQFTEIDRRVPDNQKLKSFIGREPDTKLDFMLDKFLDYYKENEGFMPGHF